MRNPASLVFLLAFAGCSSQPSADPEAAPALDAAPDRGADVTSEEAAPDAEPEAASDSPQESSEPLADACADDAGDDWWPQPCDGPSFGEATGDDNGDCLLACSAGNYNQAFKRELCKAGKSPGVEAVFYDGHYQFWGLLWDEMGTGQDHQGVCVTTHVADVGGSGVAASRRIFHDGCTGYPDGNPRKMTIGPNAGWTPENWGQAFHGACIVHDLCYKAEPAFSGKTKEFCDDQLEIHAQKICYASYTTDGGGVLQKNDLDKCLAEAANARFWLNLGSDNHYSSYNYPYDWRPEGGLCGAGKTYDVAANTCAVLEQQADGGRMR